MKALTEYTDRELLRKFAELVFTYDDARDEEVNFLTDHPNRDMWEDDMVKEYDEICENIKNRFRELVMIDAHIKTLK